MQLVVLALLLLLFLAGLMSLEIGEQAVRSKQARAAAESAALYTLRNMHGPDYAVADAAGKTPVPFEWDQLITLARANGMDPKAFHPMDPADVQVGPTWAAVTVRPRKAKHQPVTAAAVGVPAGRIHQGRAWLDPEGRVEQVSGCLPLGIQLTAIPVTNSEEVIRLALGADGSPAAFVGLPGSDHPPAEQIAFLGYEPLQPIQGAAPPAVEVGAEVTFLPAEPELIAEAAARLPGRVVIVPFLHDAEIVGFGRMRLTAIEPEPPVVSVRLVPSAIGRLAAAGGQAKRVKVAASDVSPVGLVLRVRRGG